MAGHPRSPDGTRLSPSWRVRAASGPSCRVLSLSLRGPVAFVLFWVVALGVGTALVLLLLSDGFGWLVLTAPAAIALLLIGMPRARRQR